MLPSYWTVYFTTRASSRSKSIIPTPTVIPRSTSPPSPCWACASARASEESSTSASTGSIPLLGDLLSVDGLVSRADQTIDTEQIAEQWDRMGQLYASLKTGHVTASVALKRLVGLSAKNSFYRANRDLG